MAFINAIKSFRIWGIIENILLKQAQMQYQTLKYWKKK